MYKQVKHLISIYLSMYIYKYIKKFIQPQQNTKMIQNYQKVFGQSKNATEHPKTTTLCLNG